MTCNRLYSVPPVSGPFLQALRARNTGSLGNSAEPCWAAQEAESKRATVTLLLQQTERRWVRLIN